MTYKHKSERMCKKQNYNNQFIKSIMNVSMHIPVEKWLHSEFDTI